jgi:hypothetical protein
VYYDAYVSTKRALQRVAILFVLIVVSCFSATLVNAANNAGGKCSKVGVTTNSGSKTLKCTKVGKNLVWVVQSNKSGSGSGASGSGSSSSGAQPTSQKDIPAIIQNWGFNLADFNSSTGMAGDMLIKGVVPPTFTGATAAEDNAMYRHLIGVIGEIVRGAVEPQLAFIVPLGTSVISMVTGTVCDVPKLYSNDYSIRIAPPGMACMQGGAYILFEHEHVLAPSVKVGDKVTAGQKIAIASDYNPHWKAKGLGIIETGVFFSKKGSNAPWHACLTSYLDPSKKTAMLSTFSKALAAWETERSDASLYNESAMSPVGCYTTEEMTDSNKGTG